MELNSREQVEAYSALKKSQRIERLQRTIDKLDYVPACCFFCMFAISGLIQFSEINFSAPSAFLLLAANIAGIGQAAMKKSALLYQLYTLKANNEFT